MIKGLGVCLFGKDGMFESTFCHQICGACLEACIIIYQMCCKANYQMGVYLYFVTYDISTLIRPVSYMSC